MKETEITVQVFDSLESTIKKLKALGFSLAHEFTITDYYFSHFQDISSLSYHNLVNNSFLVRNIDGENHHMELCYKCKTYDENSSVISEEKTKAPISDLGNTLSIFMKSGLNNYCTLVNHSYVFQKDDIEFALQDVRGLGVFIEIEEFGSMATLSPHQKIKALASIANSLGLNLGCDFSCKKVMMMLNKVKA